MNGRTLLMAAMLAAVPVSAQELLTMDRAVTLALEQNTMLGAARHAREAAAWQHRGAVANFLPRVDLAADFTRIDPETDRRANSSITFIREAGPALGIPPSALSQLRPFAYRDAFSTTLTVVQPVYNGGAELAGLDVSSAALDRSAYALQETEQQTVAGVRMAYLGVLKAQAMLELARESLARTNRWLELTRRREELGSRTKTDVLRFNVESAAGEGMIINAENALASARLRLNEIMGVALSSQYTLQIPAELDSVLARAGDPSLLPVSAAGDPAPTSTDQAFLGSHPAMLAMESAVRMADAGVTLSRVNFQPRVNLAFQYGWEKNGTIDLDGYRPWALALSVQWPIFNGFGDYAGLQAAGEQRERAEQEAEGFRRGLVLQAANAGLALKSAVKRIDISRVALEQAHEVLASVTRRYEAGAASNVDLIDAQTAYNGARTNFITAVHDRSIADLQFRLATGRITR